MRASLREPSWRGILAWLVCASVAYAGVVWLACKIAGPVR